MQATPLSAKGNMIAYVATAIAETALLHLLSAGVTAATQMQSIRF
jgi:tartrate dehydratase beta subunit/fumarate hydratase class I family protein